MLQGRNPLRPSRTSHGASPEPNYAVASSLRGNDACDLLDLGDPKVHCALHVPRNYEPNYAYPLLVWFHDDGGDERDMHELLPRISAHNYVGISLRAPLPVARGLPEQRRWSATEAYLNLLEEEVAVCLQDATERLNIHRHRIVTIGMGAGGTIALRMLLRRPDWFAGAVCLGAQWPKGTRIEHWGNYAGKPLWLGHLYGWSPRRANAAIFSSRLLQTAGFNVTARIADVLDISVEQLAAEIDHWLLRSLCPQTVVH